MSISVFLVFLAVSSLKKAEISPADARIVSLLDRSNYVFAGTLKRSGASNLTTLKAAPDLAVVHVDTLLAAPSELRHTAGSDITVQLAHPELLKEGSSVLFYANVGAIGNTVGVIEVAHQDGAEAGKLRQDLSRYQQLTSDLRLSRRLDGADLVVSGKVSRTQRADFREGGVSEHAPDWWIATVEVQSVEKAPQSAAAPRSVEVAFPKSDDEHWMFSHKFKEGETGVWVLRPFATRVQTTNGTVLYTALDPLDFQPMGELERIRALLKQPIRISAP